MRFLTRSFGEVNFVGWIKQRSDGSNEKGTSAGIRAQPRERAVGGDSYESNLYPLLPT